MTLRGRLTAHLALVAIVSCALTVAVAIVLVRHHIASVRLAQLNAQTVILAGETGLSRQTGSHVYLAGSTPRTILRVPSRRRSRAILAAIPGGDGEGTVDVRGRKLLYAAHRTSGGRIVLFRAAGLVFAEWRPFLLSLVLAGAGGALLAVILALALSRRLTRPIAALAAATRRVADGEPDVAVPVAGSDELAGLGRSFNTMSEQLTAARTGQRRFLESVGHELKTPLTSIRGYAEALQEAVVAPQAGGRIIAAEAQRLERLVADLMELARLGRAEFTVAREPVDLARIADAALTRHRPRARELGVTLSGETDGPAGAVADGERLLQATSNLIENALRLTPSGGAVTVSATPGRLEVSDTGPGLADADLPRAFERFYLHERYRSDPERATGSGLGLAIVAELVTAMGATASVQSRPGEGARFSITLPVAAAPPAPDALRD